MTLVQEVVFVDRLSPYISIDTVRSERDSPKKKQMRKRNKLINNTGKILLLSDLWPDLWQLYSL